MSNRYGDFYKGSSRSSRDDSRTPKQHRENPRDVRGTKYSRSRSRSPRRQDSPPARSGAYSPDRPGRSSSRYKDHKQDKTSYKLSSNDWEDSDEEVPAPPPPPRITKVTIGFKEPVKMTLSGGTKPVANVPKPTVASVFNDDDDDEPEEMPAEAKMRMRNIGRETPTSAGPNSFGKTKQGFCDAKKVFEKNLKHALETNPTEKAMKFPQTIYKIKGP